MAFLSWRRWFRALPECLAIGFEKFSFFAGRGPGKHCVAMGKASTARDDIPVAGPSLNAAFHISVPFRSCVPQQPVEQNDPPVLFPDVFGMMEGVIEPNSRYGGECGVELLFDGGGHNFEGMDIALIGPWRIAINVSRELVEQQDKRQRAVGRGLPCGKFTGAGLGYEVAEPGAYVIVHGRTAPIPPVSSGGRRCRALEAGAEPEGDNFGYGIGAQGKLPNTNAYRR